MKKSKQYQKGKHFYVTSRGKKEVHTIKKATPPETEFDENYQEVYVDDFHFEKTEEGIKIFFGKKIFGTDKAKLKRTIVLPKNTFKKMMGILENLMKK